MNNDIKLTDLFKEKSRGVSDIPPSGGTGLRQSTT
jgi:hypothetical protein